MVRLLLDDDLFRRVRDDPRTKVRNLIADAVSCVVCGGARPRARAGTRGGAGRATRARGRGRGVPVRYILHIAMFKGVGFLGNSLRCGRTRSLHTRRPISTEGARYSYRQRKREDTHDPDTSHDCRLSTHPSHDSPARGMCSSSVRSGIAQRRLAAARPPRFTTQTPRARTRAAWQARLAVPPSEPLASAPRIRLHLRGSHRVLTRCKLR